MNYCSQSLYFIYFHGLTKFRIVYNYIAGPSQEHGIRSSKFRSLPYREFDKIIINILLGDYASLTTNLCIRTSYRIS